LFPFGIGAWDAEDEQALVPVSYDDPRVARVPIPLGRDHEASVLACVEFHKHDDSFLASVISSVVIGNHRMRQQCASSSAVAPVSLLGPPRGLTVGTPGRGAAIFLQRA
jgi:hypothetical protein